LPFALIALIASNAAGAAPGPGLDAGHPRLEVFAGPSSGDEGNLFAGHVGLEFVAAEALGFAVAPQFGIASSDNVDDDQGVIASLDLMLRWYPLRLGRFSTFIEAGPGIQYAGSTSFPASGTHANFRLRAGIGARWQVAERWDVTAGYNWLHMSTGNVLEPNVGHDGPIYTLGAAMRLRR
jgi:opacity protein-like surface antigen